MYNPIRHEVRGCSFLEIFPKNEAAGEVSFVCTECGYVFTFTALDFHTHEDVFNLHTSEHIDVFHKFKADQMGNLHPRDEVLTDALARQQGYHKQVMGDAKSSLSKDYFKGLMTAYQQCIDKLGIDQFYELFKVEMGITPGVKNNLDWSGISDKIANQIMSTMQEPDFLRKAMDPSKFKDVPKVDADTDSLRDSILAGMGVPKDMLFASGRQSGKTKAMEHAMRPYSISTKFHKTADKLTGHTVRQSFVDELLSDVAKESARRIDHELIYGSVLETKKLDSNGDLIRHIRAGGGFDPSELGSKLPLGVKPEDALSGLEFFSIPPTNPKDGDTYYDPREEKQKIYSNGKWIQIAGFEGSKFENQMMGSFHLGHDESVTDMMVDGNPRVGAPVYMHSDGRVRSYPPQAHGETVEQLGIVQNVSPDQTTCTVVIRQKVIGEVVAPYRKKKKKSKLW